MIKKTLYFGNPAYLSLKDNQLVIKTKEFTSIDEQEEVIKTRPVEDIGFVVLDNPQITITNPLIEHLVENNCALITCNSSHMPTGLLMPLASNSVQNERFRYQIEASLPLRKQLWQQTIQQKILNQSAVYEKFTHRDAIKLRNWAERVKSGDPENIEGHAAYYYWQGLFENVDGFVRGQEGPAPNQLLNYGYALLRATMARSLLSSGLMVTLGIHHHNRYNAYCLADDIMEPYRPYVDRMVAEIVYSGQDYSELTPQIKGRLLSIPAMEVNIKGERSPLMVATTTTAASLYKCFAGESRKIIYPEMI